MSRCLESPSLSHDAISLQLERMLTRPDFKATPQQVALLKYVVEKTLAGNADEIKGYTVATEVFGRRSDFDQNIDPIVSIQAARLRRALASYYQGAGQHDPLRIDIPKGTYVPVFCEPDPRPEIVAVPKGATSGCIQTWPTLTVNPLANLTADPEDDYLAIGLVTELTHALGHYPELRVRETLHRGPASVAAEPQSDFFLDGNVRRDPTSITISLRLLDARKGFQIWSGKYQGTLDAAKLIAFQEELADKVAYRLSGGYAVIPRHLAERSAHKPTSGLSTHEAMLRYWVYDARRTRPSFERAINALEHAAVRDRGCGPVWTMLARLYADNYGLEIADRSTPLDKAAAYARKGVSLDPNSRRARATLAYVRLLEDRRREALSEIEAAFGLHSQSSIYLDVLGWLMCLAGDWARGADCLGKAFATNPYSRPWARHGPFLNCFRTGNYEAAYRESLRFMMPDQFWEPLLKASVCGLLGRIEEGQMSVKALLALKPDFPQRGRTLIGRYIKFDNIVQRIIAGLAAVGVTVR